MNLMSIVRFGRAFDDYKRESPYQSTRVEYAQKLVDAFRAVDSEELDFELDEDVESDVEALTTVLRRCRDDSEMSRRVSSALEQAVVRLANAIITADTAFLDEAAQ